MGCPGVQPGGNNSQDLRRPPMHSDQPHKLPGTPQLQTSAAAAPFASSKPTAFGRSLASPHRSQAAAAVLPKPVLQCIFSYLPLSSHSQCALVCRHWHASVPATRKEVARWVAESGHHNLQVSQQVAASYSHRIKPWLRAERSPFLPIVERQQQELLRLQDCLLQAQSPQAHEQLHQHEQTARRLFCSLVHYSLDRQLTQADHLTLQPSSPLPDLRNLARVSFSFCGRWLAEILCPTAPASGRFLRLYAWQQGDWHPQTLSPTNGLPPGTGGSLEKCIFSFGLPDTLLCHYSGGQVGSWHPSPDSGVWNYAPILQMDEGTDIKEIFTSADGDLVIMLQKSNPPRQGLLVLHYRGEEQGWGPVVAKWYDRILVTAYDSGWRQWALATVTTEGDTQVTAISILERGLNAPPGIWGEQQTLLASGQRPLALHYSPDASHLLGLLAGQRAVLWHLDHKHRLVQKLEVTCVFSESEKDLNAQRLFYQNGKRLALALSSHCIQFWVKHSSGHWHPGATLNIPSDARDRSDDQLRYILWPADGRTLVRVMHHQLDIWCWHSARWTRMTELTREDARAPSPAAWLLPPSYSHCLATHGREGRLWIYGPDSHGTVSQKASLALGAPVSLLLFGLNGLWLFTYSQQSYCGRLVQMTTRAEGGTGMHSSVTDETLATPGLTAGEENEEQETEPALHEPESRQPERQQRVSPASLAHAQRLPTEILDKILGYVPLSQHSNCALVCRHWYDSLPDTGLRLARWYNSLSADQKSRSRLLAAGYSRRARPFLQAARSPLLPVLDCQHQELLHQQAQLRQLGSQPSDTRQKLQQQVDRSFRLLSALVHYSQHRQIIQPQQLGLAPAPFSDAADTVSFRYLTFSPCGRWLAVICQPGNARATLMLYGWSEGTWHRQPLVPGLKQSVSDVIFSRTDPDMLITTHSLKTCIWRREADTGSWRFQQGWKRSTFDHWCTHSMEGGDIVIVATRRLESGEKMEALVLFYRYINAEQGWGKTGACTFTGNILSTHAHPPVDQLVLCTSLNHADVIRNTVHIYFRRPGRSGPAQWYCRESVLQQTKVEAVQIQYSPANYSHLLVLMQNWQLVLLEQDAQHRLHELLTVDTCIAPQSQLDNGIGLESLLSGTRQLAVPYSAHKIQFWQENADRVWEPGDRIEASSEPDEHLCSVLFCNPGHTLVRQTNKCIDIWHRGACWQHLVRHEREETDAPSVPVLMSANGVLCVTTADATGSLWLYAPDSRGVPTRKVSTNIGERIEDLVCSNDGLSVVVRSTTTDRALQLVPLPDGTGPEDAPQLP